MQSNVQRGDLVLPAYVDLSEVEDYLLKLVNDGGVAKFALPTDNGDHAYYINIFGAAAGSDVTARPLEPGRNVLLPLKGTCNPGDVLVLADTSVEADRGKIRALPTAAGTYRGLAIAEEAGVDGQLLKCRPAAIGNITVTA